MLGGFRVGRWLGFEIRIDYSWFVVFFLVLWTFSTWEFPHRLPGRTSFEYVLMGTAGALLFFLSVLLHELSHSVVARSRGIQVEGITLFIFGGVAQMRMEARRPVDEFLLTLAGPLTSILLAGMFYGIVLAGDVLGPALPPPAVAVSEFLALLNLVLAIFNLIPAFPLDGGRLFRSAVWKFTGNLERATRWATWAGRGFGWLLAAWGLWLLFAGFWIEGIWAAMIGWFLANAAAASWRQFVLRKSLAGIPVSRVMMPDPVTVPGDTSAAEAARQHFLRRPYSAYPVVRDGHLVGLVSLDDLAGVPPDRRDVTPVEEIMRPLDDVDVVGPEESLDEVLARLEPSGKGRVLVVDDGRLVGLLTLRDVGAWVERARRLRMEGGDASDGPGARVVREPGAPVPGEPGGHDTDGRMGG